MKIRVENTYEDGHESTIEYGIDDERVAEYIADPEFDGNVNEALHDLFFEYTGDGHGTVYHDCGMIAEITIIEASDESLVGTTYEIGG